MKSIQEFMETKPTSTRLSDIFTTEDTTDNLNAFMNSTSKPKEQIKPIYFWPTEVDPHAADVVKWAEENTGLLFPKISNQ